ncbi:hypothetical protein AruPA_07755 [Acidiphilium sp. PA]|uniref:hypothetical protein n=1 Tax=Acidiphilium sp. PA TaxID=2871705 RepID=UPI0022444839|nr:hypothetical protein [Acidiphilium sp. PA]MCW8306928.1 hypothetical protein [Acidiphilium sp. PA]
MGSNPAGDANPSHALRPASRAATDAIANSAFAPPTPLFYKARVSETRAQPPFTIVCFATVMDALCAVVAEKGRAAFIPAPMVHLIWTRLRNLTARFLAALARGAHPARPNRPAPKPQARPNAEPAAAPSDQPRRKRLTLPRREAWLYRLLPETGFARFGLQHLLSDAEFTGFLQANPKLIRILAPLYHAMGIDLPAEPPFFPDHPPIVDSRRHVLFGAPEPDPSEPATPAPPPPGPDCKNRPA